MILRPSPFFAIAPDECRANPHLKVLERAKLISRSKNAQWRPCRLEEAPLRTAAAWIEEQRQIWESRLNRLESYLHVMESSNARNDDE